MNIKQLEYFEAVARTGSFSEGARVLGVSQPPVSTQIRLLEEDLGVKLFDRTSRSARLTEAGVLLYQQAESILDMMSSTRRKLENYSARQGGIVSLGTISSSGAYLIREALPAFHAAHPGIDYEITEGNTFQLVEKLHEGVIELALLRTPFHDEGLTGRLLAEETMTAAGAAAYFEGLPDGPVKLRTLADRPFIYYRRFEHLFWSRFERLGIRPRVVCVCDDARTAYLWAEAGVGVALIPECVPRIFGAPGTEGGSAIQVRPLAEPELETKMLLVRRSDRVLSAAAEIMWDELGK